MPLGVAKDELSFYNQPHGADEILALVQPVHDKLYLHKTGLGDIGISTLLNGLDEIRDRYKRPVDGGRWGLSRIEIMKDAITDVGLAAILEYASRDVRMTNLAIVETSVEKLRLDSIDLGTALNSLPISALTMINNQLISAEGVSRLFRNLCSPTLRTLCLDDCRLESATAEAATAYLGDSRSRFLKELDLEGSDIDLQALRSMIDTIERRNFTLHHLHVQYGGFHTYQLLNHRTRDVLGARAEAKAEFDRLTRCLKRNRALGRRVSRAARRCLPIARIILNDRSLLAIRTSARQQARKRKRTELEVGSAGFRLMDLPLDIIDLVVRHTSGDASALSDAQFARIRREALGKGELKGAVRKAATGRSKLAAESWEKAARRDWLERHGLDRWDSQSQR